MKTLVLYSTKHGTTEEVARHIAGRMEGEAYVARLGMLHEPVLKGVDNVILGGPEYFGRWDKICIDYANRHELELSQIKFSVFVVGNGIERGPDAALLSLPLALSAKINASAKVGGAIVVSRLNLLERLIIRIVSGTSHDSYNIDWTAVDRFARAAA